MLVSKYVDIITGEIVAYKFSNRGFCAILSEQRAKELNLEDSDILEYLDISVVQCLKYEDKLYTLGMECGDMLYRYSSDRKLLENIDYRRELLENTPEYNYNGEYEEDDQKILLLGYVFNKYSGVVIDNETAIRRFLEGSEECM